MAYPFLPIGQRRLTRQAATAPRPIGAVVTHAFFGPAPPLVVSLFAVTGDERDIGTGPTITILPTRGDLIDVDVSGAEGGRRFYQRKGSIVAGGNVTVEPKLFLATKENTLLDDISWMMDGPGRVKVDPSADPIWNFEAEAIIHDDLPEAYQHWFAPVLDLITTRSDGLGRVRTRQQLGLYKTRPYPQRVDQWGGTVLMRGYDALWTLRSDFPGSPYTVAAGTNYSEAVRTILDARGFTRHSIQSTGNVLPRKRSWDSDTSWLQIINNLLRGNGFLPLAPDNTGQLRSRRFQRIGDLDPAATHTAADVVETVVIEPDEERFANHVLVEGTSPSGASFRREITNNDPNSPSSTVVLDFTKGIYEKSPDYRSQSAVDDRAEYLMERANSLQVRMQVRTKMLREFALHEAIKFDLSTNAGRRVATGKWRMEQVEVIMSEDCQPTWVVSRLEPFEEVA